MTSPFDILGIPPSFDLDLAAVEQRYRELSRVVHPDKFTGTGAQERRRALSLAVDVNAAWRLLKDPIRRAEALLAVHGIASDERSQPKASPALLMEVMELREELADARSRRDVAKIRALAKSVSDREAGVLARLSDGFRSLAGAPDGASSLVALVGELRYTRRFLDEVKSIEDDIADEPVAAAGT